MMLKEKELRRRADHRGPRARQGRRRPQRARRRLCGVGLHDVGDHVLAGHFVGHAHFRLQPQARETQRRLAAAAVLLGQIHGNLVDHLAMVPRERPEQTTVAVHHHDQMPGAVDGVAEVVLVRRVVVVALCAWRVFVSSL